LLIEFHHAVALGVMHRIGEHCRPALRFRGFLQIAGQLVAIKNVISQYQHARVATDKVRADNERLSDAFRLGLHRVGKIQAPARPVAQQLLEARRVLRGGNNQNVAYPGQHQRGQGIVDHRLVVHRQQLLGNRQRHRMQTGARTAGEDDAFALVMGHG